MCARTADVHCDVSGGPDRLPGQPITLVAPSVAGASSTRSGTSLGLVGREGTPKSIADKLSAVVSQDLSDLATRQNVLSQGVEPVGTSPEQFAGFIETETKRYSTAANFAGIQRT